MEVVSTYRYEKIRRIDGGQGKNSLGVFEALDVQLDRRIAVKEIAKQEFGRDTKSYFSEAQAMFRSAHPNVVPIIVAVETQEVVALCMPLYSRGCLANRIVENPLPVRDVLRVAQQAIAGLSAIHAGGTIHFDVKPTNILFSDDGVAMIADFGQARESGPEAVTLLPPRMYVPATPPESFVNGWRGTVESDVYQMGVTLYRAVNGDRHFNDLFDSIEGRDELRTAVCSGEFPDRKQFLPHVPQQLRRIIRKAMHVDPTCRFASAVDLGNALARVQVQHNWECNCGPGGTISWTCERSGQSNLLVELRGAGELWEACIFTVGANGKRRKTRTGEWRSDVPRDVALAHLNSLFAELG